jgi:hypothetical protein
MPCHRCCSTACALRTYFLRWSHDVSGYFALCDNCVEDYLIYVVEEDEDDE